MEKEPNKKNKPKKAEKTKVNYTSKNNIYLNSSSMIDYSGRINKILHYNIGLLIRAELYRRGLTVRGLSILLSERGVRLHHTVISTILAGSSNRWNYAVLYYCAWGLGIDLDFSKIDEARNYLLSSGRSVKEL
jgi:hypothetical protein